MRVLIIGADGLIGSSLCREMERKGVDVYKTSRKGNGIFLDLFDDRIPPLPEVDVAVICAASSKFSDCREYPERSRIANVLSPAAIAEQLSGNGTHVILLSTSAVFDCKSPHARAEKEKRPTSAYGKMKAEAEDRVLALNGTVLRLTKIVHETQTALPAMIQQMRSGLPVSAFTDHTISPISIEDVTDSLFGIAMSSERGIFQISGRNDISYFSCAEYLADCLGYDKTTIAPQKAAEILPAEEVTPFTSLNTDRIAKLTGFVPPNAPSVLLNLLAPPFPRA